MFVTISLEMTAMPAASSRLMSLIRPLIDRTKSTTSVLYLCASVAHSSLLSLHFTRNVLYAPFPITSNAFVFTYDVKHSSETVAPSPLSMPMWFVVSPPSLIMTYFFSRVVVFSLTDKSNFLGLVFPSASLKTTCSYQEN